MKVAVVRSSTQVLLKTAETSMLMKLRRHCCGKFSWPFTRNKMPANKCTVSSSIQKYTGWVRNPNHHFPIHIPGVLAIDRDTFPVQRAYCVISLMEIMRWEVCSLCLGADLFCKNAISRNLFRIRFFFFFSFLGWSETESTWYVGH
jgi:hypothetical protein